MVSQVGTSNPVVAAINRNVSDSRVRLAMLVGSHMESGWNASAKGDYGHGRYNSFGPFQINFPSHPGVTEAQATNPDWAVKYMLGEYQGAVARVPASMWSSDPKSAAALAAFYAERPAVMYGQGAINSAWSDITSGNLSTAGAGSTGSAPVTTGGVVSNFGIPGLGGVATSASTIVISALFTLGGIGLIVMGAWRASAQVKGTP